MKFNLQAYIKIPLFEMPTGHHYAEIRVNGMLGTFLLDTGASKSCVGVEESPQFSIIPKEGPREAAGAGSEKLVVHPSEKSSLSYEKYQLGKLNFLLLDLSAINASLANEGADAIDGILGADFFYKKKAIICYQPAVLYLKK